MAALKPLSINKEITSRLNRILADSSYKDVIENSASYNTRLCVERKMRLPFLDAQTGVAQSDCALWIPKWQRMPGTTQGQVYTYPAKRWFKKRRQYLMNDRYLTHRGKETDSLEQAKNATRDQNPVPSPETHSAGMAENSMKGEQEDSLDKMGDDSKDSWLKDIENVGDPPTLSTQMDDRESDYTEYDESFKKKKRKVKTARPKRKIEKSDCNDEKPYSCHICGMRYKTRPGLTYHYAHSHNDNAETTEEDTNQSLPSRSSRSASSTTSVKTQDSCSSSRKFQDSFTTFLKSSNNGTSDHVSTNSNTESAKAVSPSPYCDFCLGDNIENKKTLLAEELVSCSDCGRSAHPTCLQFTPSMTLAVKKYLWQCIECKSCGLCGTSDNDDQLLFCDDCDRGYHMYCLSPPLHEPPEDEEENCIVECPVVSASES